MKTLFYLLFFLTPLLSFGQINSEHSYEGKTVVEWIYNYKTTTYKQVSKLPLATKIIVSETAIWFRKGVEASWLENTWFFDSKSSNSSGTEILTYYDERNQKVVVDIENNKITYYYEYNNKTKVYENYAEYLSLTENEKILSGFYLDTENLNLDKRVLNFTKVKSNLEGKKDVEERNSFILNYTKDFNVYHYRGKHDFEVYTSLDYEETKDEDGDEIFKITFKNKKGEQFNVIFFDEEYEVIGIEKEKETLFYTN